MFTIIGTTRIPTGRRREASLSWDDGIFSGDQRLVEEADFLTSRGLWVKATPTGPGSVAGTTPVETAAITAASLFERFDVKTGDFPIELLDYEGVS